METALDGQNAAIVRNSHKKKVLALGIVVMILLLLILWSDCVSILANNIVCE